MTVWTAMAAGRVWCAKLLFVLIPLSRCATDATVDCPHAGYTLSYKELSNWTGIERGMLSACQCDYGLLCDCSTKKCSKRCPDDRPVPWYTESTFGTACHSKAYRFTDAECRGCGVTPHCGGVGACPPGTYRFMCRCVPDHIRPRNRSGHPVPFLPTRSKAPLPTMATPQVTRTGDMYRSLISPVPGDSATRQSSNSPAAHSSSAGKVLAQSLPALVSLSSVAVLLLVIGALLRYYRKKSRRDLNTSTSDEGVTVGCQHTSTSISGDVVVAAPRSCYTYPRYVVVLHRYNTLSREFVVVEEVSDLTGASFPLAIPGHSAGLYVARIDGVEESGDRSTLEVQNLEDGAQGDLPDMLHWPSDQPVQIASTGPGRSRLIIQLPRLSANEQVAYPTFEISQRRVGSRSWVEVGKSSSDKQSFTFSGEVLDGRYEVRVVGISADGEERSQPTTSWVFGTLGRGDVVVAAPKSRYPYPRFVAVLYRYDTASRLFVVVEEVSDLTSTSFPLAISGCGAGLYTARIDGVEESGDRSTLEVQNLEEGVQGELPVMLHWPPAQPLQIPGRYGLATVRPTTKERFFTCSDRRTG